MVRNEEKKAFRDMTPEERSEIVEALLVGEVETHGYGEWQGPVSLIAPDAIYRTKPRKLVIPWEVIRPEYKWAAMDEDGGVWFFTHKPKIDGEDLYWSCGGDFCQSALNIDTAGIDWRESLTERPEGV